MLAKADLVTDMVGEFPELQGLMGRYYALHDHEPAEVAEALREQYLPRRPLLLRRENGLLNVLRPLLVLGR